jgi:protein-L-isoaspartate(D-aspartate) O-methyltransferase
MKRRKQPDYSRERIEMVTDQIERRGIMDPRLLAVLRKVPRHEYIPQKELISAYSDSPLPIGHSQTISQPYIVAFMTDALRLTGSERVLEIGTGSGYQTAILAELTGEVFTIEIIEALALEAKERLKGAGYENIRFKIGDGKPGWPEESPFDGIIVTAAPETDPVGLANQLSDGGRMIVPVGSTHQILKRMTRRGRKVKTETLLDVRFVPLV